MISAAVVFRLASVFVCWVALYLPRSICFQILLGHRNYILGHALPYFEPPKQTVWVLGELFCFVLSHLNI